MSPRPAIAGIICILGLLCAGPPARAYPDEFGTIDEVFAFFGRIVRDPAVGGNQEFGVGFLGGRFQAFPGAAKSVDWNRLLAKGMQPIAHSHPWSAPLLRAEG